MTGWVRRDVKEPESIADHMYRMGLMALISSDTPGVNRENNPVIKIHLIIIWSFYKLFLLMTPRKLRERNGIDSVLNVKCFAIVGDITPDDGIPKKEKSRREREALKHMCELLGGGERAKEISDLWMEYEENSSLEAKLVKDFDKNLKDITIATFLLVTID
ncbi:metal-dependent phosphohydrolase HD domain-containing protein [Striga asiatica]|uniref:Metal-dependent phosphohydrolase HD domain-containing protein n=1 Tax=Striga asiatica TaxID=4170 RepID=A0A5A7R478_STRAF|nr:metal-dependent phosphohydrolase HD domain-containing protein [Striga asiatica]